MGIESFSVILRAERTDSIENVQGLLESYPKIKFVRNETRGIAYECSDGQGIFEVLLRGSNDEPEFELAVRFAFCNPDSITRRFLDFIAWAESMWHPRLWQMSSASKEKVTFEAEELTEFRERAPAEIDSLRLVWQKAFGTQRGEVRVEDVYRWLDSKQSSTG